MLRTFFSRRRGADKATSRLYGQIVAQARQVAFYADLGVPDTLAGRFDMIVLHAVLVMRRLRRDGAAGRALAQTLFDTLFGDMDRNLREMGVSDLGVPKRVRGMAEAFYGRASAYDPALDARDEAALAVSLRRNIFAGGETEKAALALAGYAMLAEDMLADTEYSRVAGGELIWPKPPLVPEA